MLISNQGKRQELTVSGSRFRLREQVRKEVNLVKSLLALAILGALTALFIAGCGGGPKIEIEPAEVIDTAVEREFTVSRSFDLNSAYAWREKHDEAMLELVDTAVGSTEREDGSIALSQDFTFRARKKGVAVISLDFVRHTSSGTEIARQEFVQVNIE